MDTRVIISGARKKEMRWHVLESVVRVEQDNAAFWRAAELKTQHQVRAQKAAKTRLRKRIEHGVCPHCKRHFENVERHVKSKHPKELAE